MQVFGGATNATAIMLKIHSGGIIKRYDNEILTTDAYDKWIHVNVQHDADNGDRNPLQILVFCLIDGRRQVI